MQHADFEQLIARITDQVVTHFARDESQHAARWLCDPLNDTTFRCTRCIPADLIGAAPDRIGCLPLGAEGLPAEDFESALAAVIDHTLLKPDATPRDVEQLCHEAVRYRFKAVCVNPLFVRLAHQVVGNSGVAVCAVVGFPLGATLSDVKAYEARRAIEEGATEIDMVLPVGMLKVGRAEYVAHDILEVVRAADGRALVKVILETCLLTDDEKRLACRLAREAGAQFVKTSTGFSTGGASAEDIRLMRAEVGREMGVKASGGIRDRAAAVRMMESGASRIGASASVQIVTDATTASPAGKY